MNLLTSITIRKAAADEASAIAECLFLAMEEIVYLFIGERNVAKGKEFLRQLVQKPANQYSYQNCWVAAFENEIVGAANIYPGDDLARLRGPVLRLLHTNYGRTVDPEDETEAGEIYLDSFGVLPGEQGRGIGARLLLFLIHEYVVKQRCTLGLLVEEENPKAKRLYLKVGFQSIGKKQLLGKKMEHMQVKPSLIFTQSSVVS